MNNNNPILVNLRNQLRQSRINAQNYVALYRNERTDRRQQEQRCRQLEQQIIELIEQNDSLRQDLDECVQHIDSFQIPKPYKKWEELQSPVSKAKRKADYRNCLEQSMMYLHEAKRVRVQMLIGKQEIFLVWSQNELRRLRNDAKNIRLPRVLNAAQGANSSPNRNVTTSNDSEDEDSIEQGESDPDAFLPDGTWNILHIRRIIHVMDMFKISYRAYHELRMTSRSILPPLNKLKKERIKMSNEIKCLHHKTVIKVQEFLCQSIAFQQMELAFVAYLILNIDIFVHFSGRCCCCTLSS